MICPVCAEPVTPGDLFCEACGSPVGVPQGVQSPQSEQCPVCGAGFDADGFCQNCGRRRPEATDHQETDFGVVAAVTDRGLRHRSNEDAYALAVGDQAVAIVVCDGVSTSSNARQGSRLAAQAAIAVLERNLDSPGEWDSAAGEAVAAAQSAIAELASDPAGEYASAPASTIVVALVGKASAVVANVGDSRAYVVTDDGAGAMVTTDDSLVFKAIQDGVPPEVAYAAPQAHQITAWLGRDAGSVIPHLQHVTLDGDAVLVVCSDGVWNYAEAAPDLAAAAAPVQRTPPLVLARRLVDFGLMAGGADNLTAAVVQWRSTDAADVT